MFELDQTTFLFSLNNGLKLYLQREAQSKIEVNADNFTNMMQAGAYFLHLKEFADCMRLAGEDGPGKIL